MPLRIALRDKPHARLTRVTPPQPKAFASLAAISRRLRSSKCGQRSRNFSDNSVTVIILLKHNLDQSPIQVTNLVPLLISGSLEPVMADEVAVPEQLMGVIISDINSRRGRN